MKLYVEWSRPIQFKDASKENMIYGIDLEQGQRRHGCLHLRAPVGLSV